MQRFRSLAAIAVAIGLLTPVPARAQSNATLSGTVTDAQNAVMPGVSITVHNSATNQDRAVVTDAQGQYVVAALPPGTYEVTAHLEGFTDQKREVPLGPAQTVGLNLKLSVGALAENVTVTGSSPLIDTATVAVPISARSRFSRSPICPSSRSRVRFNARSSDTVSISRRDRRTA